VCGIQYFPRGYESNLSDWQAGEHLSVFNCLSPQTINWRSFQRTLFFQSPYQWVSSVHVVIWTWCVIYVPVVRIIDHVSSMQGKPHAPQSLIYLLVAIFTMPVHPHGEFISTGILINPWRSGHLCWVSPRRNLFSSYGSARYVSSRVLNSCCELKFSNSQMVITRQMSLPQELIWTCWGIVYMYDWGLVDNLGPTEMWWGANIEDEPVLIAQKNFRRIYGRDVNLSVQAPRVQK